MGSSSSTPSMPSALALITAELMIFGFFGLIYNWKIGKGDKQFYILCGTLMLLGLLIILTYYLGGCSQ
jgi:hypothetical protein